MACLPGMPCFGGGTTSPKGCGIDPCNMQTTGTDLVFYNGANLPCTAVDTCDSLTVALQKMDQKLCPDAIATALFLSITNNLSIRNIFCSLVNNCIPTTTTTSSTTSTTTTSYICPCAAYRFTGGSVITQFTFYQCGQTTPTTIEVGDRITIDYCVNKSYPIVINSGDGIYTLLNDCCSLS